MHVCLHHHHLEYLLILSHDVCDILSFELPSKHIHIQLDPHCVSEWSKPILVQLFIESCSSCPNQWVLLMQYSCCLLLSSYERVLSSQLYLAWPTDRRVASVNANIPFRPASSIMAALCLLGRPPGAMPAVAI